jgi:hypothetical protein
LFSIFSILAVLLSLHLLIWLLSFNVLTSQS